MPFAARVLACAFGGWLILLWSATSSADEAAAELRGTVKDDSGLALPGVAVELDAIDGSLERSVLTDRAGIYSVSGLPAGHYQVGFRLPSFATSRRSISLDPGDVARVDVTLRVALVADV